MEPLFSANGNKAIEPQDQLQQITQDLQESEERFRELAENIEQIFWMYSVEEQRLIYISPACEKSLGFDQSTCYARTWEDWLACIHPDDRIPVLKASRQPLRGKSVEMTYRLTTPHHGERWLLARAFPVRNAVGKIYRVAGIAEDITDRQEQENWLKLLESVIVHANDAVVITEAEPVELPGPRIVYVNQAFTRMMGYAPEEVIGKTPRILQGPNTNWDTLQEIRLALKQWQTKIVEIINYHKNGSEVWIELSIFPVADRSGRYFYWVALQRDITQRKQTEAALQRQHWKSQLFADITLKVRQSLQLDAILQTTVTEVRNFLQVDRVLIYRRLEHGQGVVCTEAVIPTWHSLLGQQFPETRFFPEPTALYEAGSVRNIEDLTQAEWRSPGAQYLRQLGVRSLLVVPIVQQASTWGWLIAHQCSSARHWKQATIELLQQLTHQVEIALTQSQLLQAVQESEERFRMLANSVPVLLWVMDPEGQYLFCNQSFLDFTGRSLEQSIGVGWLESVHPQEVSHCRTTTQQALLHRESFEMEYRLRRADGEYRWVLDRGVPRWMPDGSFGGLVGSCTDITDRKQAEVDMQTALAKERELSELKSRFVSTTSHEFRTPLSTILSSADLLESYGEAASPTKQLEHIQRIQTAAVNMNHLLSDILVIERAEAKRLRCNPVHLDLRSFCETLVAELTNLDQQQHPVLLQVDSLQVKLPAYLDETLLRQILTNLLSNALKYSAVGQTVWLRLRCEESQVQFIVQDQGIGIPLGDQGRLFEPFHRGTNVGTIAGNGLGLAIVKQSVEVHHGSIQIMSQSSVGTTVQVLLPRWMEQVLPPSG
ncbi:MAG: PAS domain S-box protein [Synechococcales bacterium]|nr:PAS domain S-box protein [Synechococcales bacterium]